MTREHLGQASEAFQDYTRAIELDPNDADFFYNRGNLHQDAGRFREAVADYSRAVKLNPDYALAYNNRGNAFTGLRDLNSALKDSSKALSLDPQDSMFHLNKGICHYNRGESEEMNRHLLAAWRMGDRRVIDALRQIAGPDADLSYLDRLK